MRRLHGSAVALAFALAPACSGGDTAPKDAALDAFQFRDADVDGPNELPAFGAPTLIAEISTQTYGEDDPSMTADGLELYFTSDQPGGPGGRDIRVSTRASTSAAWGAPIVVPNLNSAATDANPEVSADGLTIWFFSGRDGQAFVDIYTSTRTTRTAAWSTPTLVTELSSSVDDRNMRVSGDGLVMYLASTRGGGASGLDIYRATRVSTSATWSMPQLVGALSTSDGDGHVSPALGDTLLIYSRSVGGTNQELYEITKTGTIHGTPRLMVEVNTAINESDPDLSEDGRTLLFSRGDGNIYTATR